MCHPIVEKCLEGFNGTVFAYGQTTSGKTHTMLGTNFDQGILSHSIKNIFQFVEDSQDDRDITIWASYMEIYNE